MILLGGHDLRFSAGAFVVIVKRKFSVALLGIIRSISVFVNVPFCGARKTETPLLIATKTKFKGLIAAPTTKQKSLIPCVNSDKWLEGGMDDRQVEMFICVMATLIR